MEPYIEFIGTLQNSGFWLVKVLSTLNRPCISPNPFKGNDPEATRPEVDLLRFPASPEGTEAVGLQVWSLESHVA